MFFLVLKVRKITEVSGVTLLHNRLQSDLQEPIPLFELEASDQRPEVMNT